MPLRYIGRKGTYEGKFLFPLLCSLKNFGVGRMVVRKSWNDRYPEPSYFIIKRAAPDLTHPELKTGHVICSHVFRGKLIGDEMKIKSGHKPDWWLVPKDEENKYLTNAKVYQPQVVPHEIEMPPLLATLYANKLEHRNPDEPVKSEDLRLHLRIRSGDKNRAIQPGKPTDTTSNTTSNTASNQKDRKGQRRWNKSSQSQNTVAM